MSEDNMTPTEREQELSRELEEFKLEKERIKNILGSLGGNISSKKEIVINIAFLVVVMTFFTLEVTTHWLPSLVSLEVGLLMLSIKIIWMMYNAHKVSHFQFWILNSIEYRMNQMDKKINEMDKKL
jgi:uncharacterized membrane protein